MSRPLRLFGLCAVLLLLMPSASAQSLADNDGPRVISSWQEDVKLADGTESVYRYEITHDYASGRSVRTAYDPSGTVIETRVLDMAPTPSPEEIEWAVGLIQADTELASLASQRNASIQGGFVLSGEQLPACAAPARCLQFDIMSPDRLESIRFVVVDLRTEAIVERDLFPNL